MSKRASSFGRRIAHSLCLFALGGVLAGAAWALAEGARTLWADAIAAAVLPWARLFHHPSQASLVPYVAACAVALGYGLFVYLRAGGLRFVRRLRASACGRYAGALALVLTALPFVVSTLLSAGARGAVAALSMAALLVRLPPERRRAGRTLGGWIAGPVCALAAIAMVFAISVEPVKLALRPVHLLNEYRIFPERPAGAPRPGEAANDTTSCDFPRKNPLEFAYQANTRGPVNHIGHVLNPLGELESGKPFERVYLQYGIGATFAFKWVMDLWGGLSLQAYYRTLLLYVAYWVLFLAAAAALFRDARYVLAAALLLAVTFYNLGFIALVIAPGINPVLHFLDAPVLMAALAFFRSGRKAPLALAAAGAAAALALNGLFGPILVLALAIAAGLFVLETAGAGERTRRLAATLAIVAAPAVAVLLALPRSRPNGVTAQFLLGFLSWSPAEAVVVATMAYLSVSYLFLIWWRDRREPLKYAAVFLFVYAQGVAIYYFWSGLANHFWPVLPYVGLHVLVMIRALGRFPRLAKLENGLVAGFVTALGLMAVVAIPSFIGERGTYRRVFERQQTYRWTFERAQVISTIDPAPIAASLEQLERYSSPSDRGVCILSSLDNLLPFLARRHSVLPHFDLQWALLTQGERERFAAVLTAARPAFLFVGHEVEEDGADPWESSWCGLGPDPERQSQRERIHEIRGLFDRVAADYERIETGPLLSVYRRRDVVAASPGQAAPTTRP